MMQLMEKRKRHDNSVGANVLHRWGPTVANFLSETLCASAKELMQVSWSHFGVRTLLISIASVPPEWMAQGRPSLTDIICSNSVAPRIQNRRISLIDYCWEWCWANHPLRVWQQPKLPFILMCIFIMFAWCSRRSG